MAASTLIATLRLRDDFSRRMVTIGRTARRTAERMVAGFRRVGRSVLNLRNALAVIAVAAAVKMASQFEKSMSQIEGLVGIAGDKVEAFSKQVLELGTRVGRGPRELADALFFITSAGLRGEEALGALEASAKAAAAGLGETKLVADAVTSAMNAYGAATLGAEQATAILVATVREGKAAAESIAGALGKVLPVASELGVSFDQVGASIAAMTRLGLNAEEATTALRSLLAALLKPSTAGAKALDEVGLSFAGLRLQLREKGLLDVLFTLKEALDGDAEAMAAVVPNVRGLTAVLNLVGASADNARAIFESLSKTTVEDLNRAFKVAEQTSSVSWGKIRASIEQAVIAFGNFVNDVGKTGVFDFLKTTLAVLKETFDGVSASQDKTATASTAVIGALKFLGFAVAGIVDGMRLLKVVIDKVRLGWLVFRRELLLMKLAIVEATASVSANTRAFGRQIAELQDQIAAIDDSRAAITKQALAMRSVATATETWSAALSEVNRRLVSQAQAALAAAVATRAMTGGMGDPRPTVFALRLRGLTDAQISLKAAMGEVADAVGQMTGEFGESITQAEAVARAHARIAAEQKAQAQSARDLAFDQRQASAAAGETARLAEIAARRAKDVTEAFRGEQVLDELKARVAALPPELRKWAEEGRKAGEMMERLVEAENRVADASRTVVASMTPLQTAIAELNREAVISSKQSAAEAAGVWKSFIKESTDFAVIQAQFATGLIQSFASSVADFVGTVLERAFEGQIRTIQDVGRIAQDVLKNLIKAVIQQLVQLAVQAAVTRAITGAAGGAVVEGGVTPVKSIPAFAGGGIIRGPGLFAAGEGGSPEAIVPMPNGNIAVEFLNGNGEGGMGATNITFNVVTPDAEGVDRFLNRPEVRDGIRSQVVDGMRDDPNMRTEMSGAV